MHGVGDEFAENGTEAPTISSKNKPRARSRKKVDQTSNNNPKRNIKQEVNYDENYEDNFEVSQI